MGVKSIFESSEKIRFERVEISIIFDTVATIFMGMKRNSSALL